MSVFKIDTIPISLTLNIGDTDNICDNLSPYFYRAVMPTSDQLFKKKIKQHIHNAEINEIFMHKSYALSLCIQSIGPICHCRLVNSIEAYAPSWWTTETNSPAASPNLIII